MQQKLGECTSQPASDLPARYGHYRIVRRGDAFSRFQYQIIVYYSVVKREQRLGNGFESEAAAIKYLNRFYPDVLLTPRLD